MEQGVAFGGRQCDTGGHGLAPGVVGSCYTDYRRAKPVSLATSPDCSLSLLVWSYLATQKWEYTMTRDPLTPDDFLALVETDLRLRHVPFDLPAVEEFCRSMAPLAFEGENDAWVPDPFLEAVGTEPGRRELGSGRRGRRTGRGELR